MANNDPVSGLYAAMSKVRQRRPEGMAMEAGTAAQAGTVLPQPKVQAPQAPSAPASYREVLPVPAPTAVPEMPLGGLESPVEETIPASGPEIVPLVAGTAGALMKASVDMSYADAYLLSLGYLFGIEPEDQVAARQATEPMAPVDRQAVLNPEVAAPAPLGTVL